MRRSRRQDAVKKTRGRRRTPSRHRSGASAGLTSPAGADDERVVRRTGSEVCAVADVVFVVLTLVVFGLLALAVRGVEKL